MTKEEKIAKDARNRFPGEIFAAPAIIIIRCYQYYLSPYIKSRQCRFLPSCSNYSIQAIEQHGLFSGVLLAYRRICRCNPTHRGGHDPVPWEFHIIHSYLVKAQTHTRGQALHLTPQPLFSACFTSHNGQSYDFSFHQMVSSHCAHDLQISMTPLFLNFYPRNYD